MSPDGIPAWLIEIAAMPTVDLGRFLDAVAKHDPRSKAGIERTDGFLTHDELLERVRGVPLDGIARLRERLRQ